jgi:glycosyltransferase involved in cell wall biosynthesis
MAKMIQTLLPDHKMDIEICNFGVVELDIDIAKQKIVYSNRAHEPLYRIRDVIATFHRFVWDRPDGDEWKLLIAGKGSKTKDLKEQVARLKLSSQIIFVGFVDTAKNIENYAKSKVYISLPESDAAAVSLMEAMYYRCLPVSYNLPASREHLVNGENGVLVDSLNENMIARVLELDSVEILTKNHEHIRAEQTVSVSRRRFKEVLLKALSKQRAS